MYNNNSKQIKMICCIIQARTGSTRLPKKVIEKIDSKNTVLDYVINQVKCSKKIEIKYQWVHTQKSTYG